MALDGGPADPAVLERLLGASANFSAANLTQSLVADVLGFYHAVDWSEPWLRGLAAFHVLVWIVAVAFRRWDNVQMLLLVGILIFSIRCCNLYRMYPRASEEQRLVRADRERIDRDAASLQLDEALSKAEALGRKSSLPSKAQPGPRRVQFVL